MTGYLLDTNVISELRKGPRANANVTGWLDANDTKELWLSVVVISEPNEALPSSNAETPTRPTYSTGGSKN